MENVTSNESWFGIVTETFDTFMNILKNNIKIYDDIFELLCKHNIEIIKHDLMIPNILSQMLFCKRFYDHNIGCRKCS